jgi:hypothetical protein
MLLKKFFENVHGYDFQGFSFQWIAAATPWLPTLKYPSLLTQNCYEGLDDHFWAKVIRTNRIPNL